MIANGRAYIGVSGTSQFGAYSGHNITVVDLSTFSIAYSVPTMGYPQTSGLLTTAYQNGDGYNYVYFFDNFTPGKLRVIRDKPGMTEVDHDYTTMAVSYTHLDVYKRQGQERSVGEPAGRRRISIHRRQISGNAGTQRLDLRPCLLYTSRWPAAARAVS